MRRATELGAIGLAGGILILLGPSSAFAWTDTLGTATAIRKVHVDELRTAVNAKRTEYACPSRSSNSAPVLVSHSFTVRSRPPVSSLFPSGLSATASTGP